MTHILVGYATSEDDTNVPSENIIHQLLSNVAPYPGRMRPCIACGKNMPFLIIAKQSI